MVVWCEPKSACFGDCLVHMSNPFLRTSDSLLKKQIASTTIVVAAPAAETPTVGSSCGL